MHGPATVGVAKARHRLFAFTRASQSGRIIAIDSCRRVEAAQRAKRPDISTQLDRPIAVPRRQNDCNCRRAVK